MTGEDKEFIRVKELDCTKVKFVNIPTSDPGVSGQIYSDSGVVTISAG